MPMRRALTSNLAVGEFGGLRLDLLGSKAASGDGGGDRRRSAVGASTENEEERNSSSKPQLSRLQKSKTSIIGMQEEVWTTPGGTADSPKVSPGGGHRKSSIFMGLAATAAAMGNQLSEALEDKLFLGDEPSDDDDEEDAIERAKSNNAWLEEQGLLGAEGMRTIDPNEFRDSSIRRTARNIMRTNRFNLVFMVLIILNTVYIGVETDHNATVGVASLDQWFWIDLFFTLAFAVELVIRFMALGLRFLKDGFNVFDFSLVVIGICDTFAVAIPAVLMSGSGDESVMDWTTSLRVLRLFRVVRILRLLRFFKELWLLVSGVLQSARTVCWAWVLILLTVYIFGILICRIVGAPHADDDEEISQFFGNVSRSMFSMFVVITSEEWVRMARISMKFEPLIWILFCIFISITTFGMMNVVTAVIVENTLEAAMRQREDIVVKADKARMKAMENIYHVFRVADTDGDGSLTKAEFQFALKRKDVIKWLHDVEIDINGAEGLFDILDYDGSGTLDSAEFVEGLMRARGGSKAKDVLQVQCEVWRAQTWLENVIDEWVEAWMLRFKSCEESLREIKKALQADDRQVRRRRGLGPAPERLEHPRIVANDRSDLVTTSMPMPYSPRGGRHGHGHAQQRRPMLTGSGFAKKPHSGLQGSSGSEDKAKKPSGLSMDPLTEKPAPGPHRQVPAHGVDSMVFAVARPARAAGGSPRSAAQRRGSGGGYPDPIANAPELLRELPQPFAQSAHGEAPLTSSSAGAGAASSTPGSAAPEERGGVGGSGGMSLPHEPDEDMPAVLKQHERALSSSSS